MFLKIVAFTLLIGVISTANCCKVSSQSYSANDGIVLLHTAHLLSFTADCPKEPVFANVNGRTVAVVRSADNKFQVSWTDEISKASSGTYDVAFYDEEGFHLFKKAQRTTANDIKPLFTINFSHSKPYRGPLYQSEFVVLVIGIVMSYFAIYYRFQIIAKKI